jgi:hypothetical protein
MKTKVGVLLFLALALVQCGKKGEESYVDFTVNPDSPTVISVGITIDGQDIVGPWYPFSLKVTNNSDRPVTIVSLETETTATVSGIAVPASNGFIGSDLSRSLVIGEATCVYSFDLFDTIPAGAEALPLSVTDVSPEGSIPATDDDDGVTCPPTTFSPIWFYVGSLPSTTNYNMPVKLMIKGWFGEKDAPEDRFEKTIYFRTQ